MFEESVPVVLTIEELWLLQSVIRHEAPTQWQGNWPAFSLELNDQIAAAIVFCEDCDSDEATLELSRSDLLAIDYCVDQRAKDSQGRLIGRALLLKTFRARSPDEVPSAEEPDSTGCSERLQKWRAQNAGTSTEHDAGDDADQDAKHTA